MSQEIRPTLARILNKLARVLAPPAGQDPTVSSGDDNLDLSTRAIFDYFPHWESRFDVDGSQFGGRFNDYTLVDTTILNHPDLAGAIDLAGKAVLELGALEGGNTLLLAQKGASRIVAVEARVDSYVKCCVIKNLYKLGPADFVLDDVRNVTLDRYGTFDVALVAGILYHLRDPEVVLANLARMAETIIVATHVAGETSPSAHAPEIEVEMHGRKYRGKEYREGGLADPHSGLESASFWPYEADLLDMIRDSGFGRVVVLDRPRRERDPYELVYLVASQH
jgi:hypothetical protein